MAQTLQHHPPRPVLLSIAVLAILGLGACSDSGGSSAPPAPPPFVPQTVSIELGESGESVSLRTTQSGGYTRNGTAFASGSNVEAENGNTYTLTLQNGQWTAAYAAPDPQELALGISGSNVEIARNEDGTYSVGGSAIETGTVMSTPVGSEYTLTLGDDGQWSATYTAPPPVTVPLGTSGQTAQIVRQENGRFTADGTEFEVNGLYEASSGLSYRISLRNSVWTASFVPTAVSVPLGDSGTSVDLIRQQDGSVMLGGATVRAGHVVNAANGARYELTFANNEWGASFLPDPQMVRLGGSGASVSLTQLQDGTFLLNGQPFMSGNTHTAGNGSEYRLTFSDGEWMTEYLAPQPVPVQLGSSGETILLERGEAGTYSANGQLVVSGSVFMASNGNTYRMQQIGQAWLATYQPGDPTTVRLGGSGTSVIITRLEDGRYQVGNISFGGTDTPLFTAPNGNQYRVALVNGEWTATFEAPPTFVQLGSSGDRIELTEREDGTFEHAGQSVMSGHVVSAANGDRFRLMESGGTWTAVMLPPPVSSVTLGNTGQTVMVTTHPDGTYSINGQPFMSGDEYTAPNGSMYRLTVSGDEWTATYTGGTVIVPLGNTGRVVELNRNEDGTFTRNNRRFRSGNIVTYLDLQYRLTYDDGEWTATLIGIGDTPIDPAPGGGTPTTPGGGDDTPSTPTLPTDTDRVATQLSSISTIPELIQFRDSGEMTRDDQGTILVIDMSGDNDPEFTVDALTSRANVLIEETFATRARAKLQDLLAEIETYRRLFEVEVIDPDEHIRGSGPTDPDALWSRAQAAVEDIFGDGTSPLDSSPWRGSTVEEDEVDDVVDELNDAIAALSSLSAFEDMFGDEFGTNDGEEFYDADISKIRFGTTSNTRFGAFAMLDLTTADNAVDSDVTWTQGAFAYSPLDRPSSADIPSRGEATYKGATTAVETSGTRNLFLGQIEVTAYFSRKVLEASVTGLEDADGEPWLHSGLEVEKIFLPEATLGTRGKFNSSGGNATIQFPAGRSQNASEANSDFDGQFVNEDREMFGVWKVGTVLEGSYGAAFSSSQSASLPSVSDSGNTIGNAAAINVEIVGDQLVIEALNDAITDLEPADRDRITDLRASSTLSRSSTGDTLVAKARNLLSGYRSAISRTPDGDVGTLWSSVQEALRIVFSADSVIPEFPTAYPTMTGTTTRDDNEARSILSDAISALGSASRFRTELQAGQLFAASSIDPNDVSKLFNAREYDFDIKVDRTPLNYTRFGAWANITHASAVDGSGDIVDPAIAKGVFAYSPLDKTVSTTVLSFTADYGGKTVAVDNSGTIWQGDFQLSVAWGSSPGTGTINGFVDNLKSGSNYVQHRELDVRNIQFFGLSAGGFDISGSPTTSVRYVDDRIRDATLGGTNSLTGRFVGNSADGPLGVIGTWEALDLNGLQGAFGADLQP